jgi:hypothetical protein
MWYRRMVCTSRKLCSFFHCERKQGAAAGVSDAISMRATGRGG